MGLVGVTTSVAALYVIDNDKGMVLTSNVPVNDFSTYHVQLDAQLARQEIIGIEDVPFGTPSYTWNMSGAPDATSVTGTSTYRLNFTWGSFSGAMRTETIALSITDGTNTIGQTFTFNVASTSSPGYNATQPTTTASWPGFLKPDSVASGQRMVGDSPYYQLGLTDGQVQLNHVLPSYNPNVAPVQLLYVSTAAVPEPIFVAHYPISTTDTTPDTLNAQLTFNGTTGTDEAIDASLYFPGDKMQIALQGGATSLSTGRYPYTFRVTDANATTVTTTYSGSVNVVNYGSSAFGSWVLAGIERVYSVSGGVLLDLGDGTSLWFASSGSGTFTTPAGDFSTLTQNTATSVYLRTMPDGTRYEFNSSGYQTAVKDRNLNTTTYTYDGSNKLTAIKDFNNQTVTLPTTEPGSAPSPIRPIESLP